MKEIIEEIDKKISEKKNKQTNMNKTIIDENIIEALDYYSSKIDKSENFKKTHEFIDKIKSELPRRNIKF